MVLNEAVRFAASLDDVWLEIYGPEMEKVMSAVIEGQRQYRNLRLFKGT